jgi:predicted dehydrogenase
LADRFEVGAVYAPVSLLAEKAASRFGLSASEGFRAVINRDDIDAVLVLSSAWHGPVPIFAACDAGKAVFYAADLPLDLTAARAIKQRVEQAGIAYVGESARRYAPATLRLKELLATRLGLPRLLFCHERIADSPDRHGTTAADPQTAAATRKLVELVDWCRYLVAGNPTAVWGIEHRPGAGDQNADYQLIHLDFSGVADFGTGPLAQISVGTYIPAAWPEAISFQPPSQLQICCQQGIAFVDLPSTLIWFDEAGRHRESLAADPPVGEQMLMHFHRAVTSLVRKTEDIEDAYRNLEIVFGARARFQQGRRTELD